jgi:N-acetylglucosamine-6-phosphate deacetylase
MLTMAAAVANAIDQGHLTLAEAVEMATISPAQFLGLGGKMGAIEAGRRSDLVLLHDDFTVERTWIGGIE